MRFYPDVPSLRFATIARDAAVLIGLLLLAWLGIAVHDAVDRLAVLGEGVNTAGTAVERGFDRAADEIDDVPVVGDEIGDGVRGAGEGTGGNVAELGERGENAAHRLADVLGAIVFALPALLLLLLWLPDRVRQVRALTSAARVLADISSPERRRLIAMRAAFSLPYGQLLEHTRDPLGDLAADRYDALVAAAFDDVGLKPR